MTGNSTDKSVTQGRARADMKGDGAVLVRLAEAAAIAGKSARTVQRWIREGKLQDLRSGENPYAPVVVSREELVRLISDRTSTLKRPINRKSGQVVASVSGEVQALRVLVEELRRDKRLLQGQVERQQAEVERLRGELELKSRQQGLAL